MTTATRPVRSYMDEALSLARSGTPLSVILCLYRPVRGVCAERRVGKKWGSDAHQLEL